MAESPQKPKETAKTAEQKGSADVSDASAVGSKEKVSLFVGDHRGSAAPVGRTNALERKIAAASKRASESRTKAAAAKKKAAVSEKKASQAVGLIHGACIGIPIPKSK